MNIIILTDSDFVKSNKIEIFDERYIHIKNILKKEVGDYLELGFLNKGISKGKVIAYSENSVCLETFDDYKPDSKSKIAIDIICALPRPQTLKKILPLIATTGTKSLHLIKSNRVEKSFFHSPLVNEREKIEKYLLEGLSQGKRTNLPEVKIFPKFKEYFASEYLNLINTNSKKVLKLIAHPGVEKNLYQHCLDAEIERVIVAVGPEGGWVPFEIEYLENLGFKKFVISESILRVENAVNAIISQKELVEMIL